MNVDGIDVATNLLNQFLQGWIDILIRQDKVISCERWSIRWRDGKFIVNSSHGCMIDDIEFDSMFQAFKAMNEGIKKDGVGNAPKLVPCWVHEHNQCECNLRCSGSEIDQKYHEPDW